MSRALTQALLVLILLATARAETSLIIDGLPSSTRDRMLRALEGRLYYVRSRPADSSRADDAAFFIKRYLRLEGYREAEVDWSLPGDGSIRLKVTGGLRYSLGNITIRTTSGQPAEEAHKDYVLQPFITRSNLAQDDYAFLREDLESGAKNLRNYLRSQGYWEAEVTFPQPTVGPQNRRINVSLTEKPGPLHILAAPVLNVSGADIPETLPAKLQRLVGKTATAEEINVMRATVETSFKKLGFQYLKLYVDQKNSAGKTTLTFTIQTGKRFQLLTISAKGDDLTRKDRITDRFKDLIGEDFDRNEINERVRMLLGTGAFTGIQADEKPSQNGTIDLDLTVSEAKPYGASVYTGVGSLEGGIFGLGFYNRNLFGELWNLNVGAEVSGLGLLGEVSLTNPFFLGRNDLGFTPRASLTTRNFDGYSKFEGVIGTELDWDVNKYYDVRFGFGIAYTETNPEDGIAPAELGIQDYVTNKLTIKQSYDRRNDVTIPTKGYLADLETELGLAIGDDSISYISNKLRFSYYHEISQKSHLSLGARLGSIVPLGDDEDLPIDLRFFSGGANSIRSFAERDLGPQSANGIPRGGQSYFIANAEYIRDLAGPLKGVVFLDAAGLATDSYSFGFPDARFAAGLGLRLHLPIGPVRLEYGHSLNRQSGEASGAFHFAIGTSF